MSFAYPEFLFALAAISVPIIIHLFNFRRFKKVYFSDIRFLKDVEVETKSRNQLKNLLILLSRILAIAFLVMAFARPFLPSGENQSAADSNSIVVFLDNSFSMNAEGEKGNLLEEAKAKAIEVASVYKNGAEIRLLTNDFNPRHFRNLSFEEFKNEVSAVQTSPQLRTFDNIVSRASGISDSKSAVSLYYLSDFQRTTSTPIETINDSLLSIYAIPSESNIQSNIYIDSCWFESPSRLPLQPDKLKVRVRNSGQETVENVSIKLSLNGTQRAVGTATISAASFEEVTLSFTNAEGGMQFAEVSVQDYPITYDDKYHLSYNLASTVNILSINGNGASNHVSNLFESENNFSLTEVSDGELDYSVLSTIDLLVCNEVSRFSSGMIQELMKFVKNGGSLLILPSESRDLNSINELLLAVGAEQFAALDSSSVKVEGVNLQSEVFKNVFTEWQE
ncbi:MAG: BatA domain-containing protein, partial [Flavobacteriales bacterium]